MEYDHFPQIERWERRAEQMKLDDVSDEDLKSALATARGLIEYLKSNPAIVNELNLPRRLRIVLSIQQLAYHDLDSGGDAQLAEWCVSQLHCLRHRYPQNFEVEQGLGSAWLLKSQRILGAIYRREGSMSMSSTSSHGRLGAPRKASNDAEDSARINSADYIEARTLLRPSMEFFERAREYAEKQGSVSGKLLEQSAEAYMSYGNVSHPRNNELCFQRALKLLRQASEIEKYEMDSYLRAFLEENIDYID